MRPVKAVGRVLLVLLLGTVAGYLSVIVSARAVENRVAGSVAAELRKQGTQALVYVVAIRRAGFRVDS
jgi:hypothetical protein